MSDLKHPGRRGFVKAAAALAVLPLAGCSKVISMDWFQDVLGSAEQLSRVLQKAVTGSRTMADEYTEADISPNFKANGSTNPADHAYQAMVKNDFADWKLEIVGLVNKPIALSLAQLRQLPSRTQITRHDCVEGWSDIAKWTGAKLSDVLDMAGPKPEAKYVMFFCADALGGMGGDKYYESIDMEGAYQPQTILAYEMNGQVLPVAHGAPIRLRYETQLGYKMPKYIMRIQLVDSYKPFGHGNGGFWEDNGYAWWGGI